jgi:hypothetical protein
MGRLTVATKACGAMVVTELGDVGGGERVSVQEVFMAGTRFVVGQRPPNITRASDEQDVTERISA